MKSVLTKILRERVYVKKKEKVLNEVGNNPKAVNRRLWIQTPCRASHHTDLTQIERLF